VARHPQTQTGRGLSRVARRPVIAIPARRSASASALRFRADVAATKLVHAVYEAGGEPFVLHPVVPANISAAELDDLVRSRIAVADAVLLPGGGDLAAHWSGQAVHETLYDVDEDQDAFDLALARVALAQGRALLAICRGSQVVNVARGGTLVQDLTEKLGRDHRPRLHQIAVEPASRLARIVAASVLPVSCYHHQALDRLGAGLIAVAHADDATIEAIELPAHDGWFLGVQWHPEDCADADAKQAALFTALVDAARHGAGRRT
jgi:putative glutamine amidotransferase